jgi:hypothetical protein
MKGGKGGTGRKNSSVRPAEKSRNPHDGPKRGAPKKDWGAVEKDPFATPGKKAPRVPTRSTPR